MGHSQCVIEFSRAVLMDVGRIRQVLMCSCNMNILSSKHGLPNIECNLKVEHTHGFSANEKMFYLYLQRTQILSNS